MKKLFLLAVLALALLTSGCINIAKTLKAAGEDRSSFTLDVQSGMVHIQYSRTNPNTNSVPHTLKPGGNVEVSK